MDTLKLCPKLTSQYMIIITNEKGVETKIYSATKFVKINSFDFLHLNDDIINKLLSTEPGRNNLTIQDRSFTVKIVNQH